MKILPVNLLRSATLTPSSESDSYPKENLYARQKFKVFKFTGYTSENLVVNKSGMQFDSVVIDKHNLTSSAVVKIQANATDSWTSPSVDITLSVLDTMSYVWGSVQTYDYFRVLIEDPTNTEAIEVGAIFLCESFDVDIRHAWTLNFTTAGRVRYRELAGNFPKLSPSQYDSILNIAENTTGTIVLSRTRQQFGTAWPVYIIVDDSDLESVLPIYAINTAGYNLIRMRTPTEFWSGAFTFEEVF